MKPPKKCMKMEQVIDVLLNSQDESFSEDEDSNSPIKLSKTPIKSQIEIKSPPIIESIIKKEIIPVKHLVSNSLDSSTSDDEDDDDDDIPLALLINKNVNKSINNTKSNETGIEGDVEDGNDEDSDDEDDIPLARLLAKNLQNSSNKSNNNPNKTKSKNNKKSLLKGIFDFIDSESEDDQEKNFNDSMSDKENDLNVNKSSRKSNSPLMSPVILFDNSNRFILSIKNLKRKKSSGLM